MRSARGHHGPFWPHGFGFITVPTSGFTFSIRYSDDADEFGHKLERGRRWRGQRKRRKAWSRFLRLMKAHPKYKAAWRAARDYNEKPRQVFSSVAEWMAHLESLKQKEP